MKRIEFVRKVALSAGYVAVAGCMSACMNKGKKTEKPVKANAEPKAEPKAESAGFNIDLNDPKYADLDKPGAYVYLNKMIIARTNDGDLVAFNRKCTHQGGPLAYDHKQGLFQCPWHGAQFSGRGEVIRGPAQVNLKSHSIAQNDSSITIIPSE